MIPLVCLSVIALQKSLKINIHQILSKISICSLFSFSLPKNNLDSYFTPFLSVCRFSWIICSPFMSCSSRVFFAIFYFFPFLHPFRINSRICPSYFFSLCRDLGLESAAVNGDCLSISNECHNCGCNNLKSTAPYTLK